MNDIEQIINFFEKKGLLLTTAESCTAGLVAATLADISGCGSVLENGYIVYSAKSKQSCLGVSPSTIEKFGLTSEEVAREMALGALKLQPANLILAITGTAESDDELNGVVCFAYALTIKGHATVLSETAHFAGERNEVRQAAARHALLKLPSCYDCLQELRLPVDGQAQ